MNVKDTPIYILTQDRVSCLRTLVDRLRLDGLNNIWVLDTGSTYPPMLEYYQQTKIAVVPCQVPEKRAPKFALWDCNVLERTQHGGYFVYTDGDVVMDYGCPTDWLEYLYHLLEKYPKFQKVGMGLRLDDLPDCYAYKDAVIKHEAALWQKSIAPHLFDSLIDTTLCLYRPGTPHTYHALRTGGKHLIRHLPWYYNTNNLPEEERHYIRKMHLYASYWTRRDWKAHRNEHTDTVKTS